MRRSARGLAGLTWILLVLGGCPSSTPAPPPPPPPPPSLSSIELNPASASVEAGVELALIATGRYSDGSARDLSALAAWSSSSPAAASVSAAGTVEATAVGQTTIQADYGGKAATSLLTVTPPGHPGLHTSGLYVNFERRGWAAEYVNGQVLTLWDQYDSVVGSTVAAEVALQMDRMVALGVNAFSFEIRSADPTNTQTFAPPDCNEPPYLGLQFPQPGAAELAGLVKLLDLAHVKGLKVWLSLVNTHMELQPPTSSQTWLAAIFAAVGSHPALDLVVLNGTTHLAPDGSCGIPAEAPLWLGAVAEPAVYVKWAMGLGISMGLQPRQLTAEAIVGDWPVLASAAQTTGSHLYDPIAVLKGIFDELGLPEDQRTYALSYYEHAKCFDAGTQPCTDLSPHDWAEATLQHVRDVIGSDPRHRLVAAETGVMPPVDPSRWNTQHALESMVFLMRKYGFEGAMYWSWVNHGNADDANPTLPQPVKQRGVTFTYNPVAREVVDMGGFHLSAVLNGSFEEAVDGGGIPVRWTVSGAGTGTRYRLDQEPGQPEVPSRGAFALRLVTGAGSSDAVTAASAAIPVQPAILHTTTANLRFAWSGDPFPTGPASARPQVQMGVRYLRGDRTPSATRAGDWQAWFQEDATAGFATFPLQYTPPADAAFVQVWFAAVRNGLPTAITLDVDNVR